MNSSASNSQVKSCRSEREQNGSTNSFQENTLFKCPSSDRLSTLSTEVLKRIFNFAGSQSSQRQLRSGLCRALLPHTNTLVYHRVSLENLSQLRQFVRTLLPGEKDGRTVKTAQRGRKLARLVTELSCFVKCGEPITDEDLKGVDWVKLLGLLENVERIELSCFPPLATALLSTVCVRMNLPFLTRVSVTEYAEDFSALLMSGLSGLSQYVRLADLRFRSIERKGTTPPLSPVSALVTQPTAFKSNVRSIDIEGDFPPKISRQLATLLSYFAMLESLTIDYPQLNRLDVILGQINSRLSCLEIFFGHKVVLPTDLDRAFAALPHLKTLRLSGEIHDAAIIAVQHCRSVKSLGIFFSGKEVTFSLFALEALLHHERRPVGLKELHIDAFDAEEGDSIAYLHEVPLTPEKHHWILPNWQQNFSFAEAQDFVAAATMMKITISGDILEALQVQSKWNKGVHEVYRRVYER